MPEAIDVMIDAIHREPARSAPIFEARNIVRALDEAGFAIVPKDSGEQLSYVGTTATLKEVHPHLCSVAYGAMVEAGRVKL